MSPTAGLLHTEGLLHDPPADGADLLGTVLAAAAGELTVESLHLDGASQQHRARGHWPAAAAGDPVLLRVLPDGRLWAIGWEPA